MASIFTKIINGEIPCHKVAETEDYLAFLDINPLTKGHTLVIPKTEVDDIFDLKEANYIGLNLFAKFVADGLKKSISCKRIGTAVLGMEVPHAHIHLVPLNNEGELNFSNKRVKMSEAELIKLASEIKKKI